MSKWNKSPCRRAGLIGHEDIEVTKAIKSLSDEFTDIEFIGPLPGDSLHYYTTPQTLKVYMAHDQALSYFKDYMESMAPMSPLVCHLLD